MSAEAAVFGVLFVCGLFQGLVEGQQTTTNKNQQGVTISFGNYLRPRQDGVRAAPEDGEEIQGGFTPLPALGLPEYVPPSPPVITESTPTKKPFRLRPRPGNPQGFSKQVEKPVHHQGLYVPVLPALFKWFF